jgi:hypothetical protein
VTGEDALSRVFFYFLKNRKDLGSIRILLIPSRKPKINGSEQNQKTGSQVLVKAGAGYGAEPKLYERAGDRKNYFGS